MQGILLTSEKVRLNNATLEQLYVKLGSNGAEDHISKGMEELAHELAKIERLYRCGRFPELQRAALTIAKIADGIGMQLAARVANDVAALTRRDDATALAAVVARLGRVGESSLIAVWDLYDLSG